ncbi:MAG: ABC transporter permease subunit [Clostridia bacterium]|jgi:multiple sugar transport system permease protein|nr:ABC transporter permease subunit [Clostridia bacterium]MQY59607.1 ABC transporter permease subunit [Clostridia bacterium]
MIPLRRYNIEISRKLREHFKVVITVLFLGGFGIVFLTPFIWMVSTSLKIESQVFTFPPSLIPNPIRWSNYIDAIYYFPFLKYLWNTLIICVFNILGVTISCSLVAYSLTKIKWKGANILFILALATLMIPFPVIMIPLFIMFRNLNWVNTFKPLIVPAFFGRPFYIFLLRQFFLTIPNELSDSAKIDGAGHARIFLRIILPLTKPALVTVVLFEFMNQWHAFLNPLIYLSDESKYTLSLGLRTFQSAYQTQWALLMAAGTLMTIPIIILFFLVQRTFIQGISLTGIKG